MGLLQVIFFPVMVYVILFGNTEISTYTFLIMSCYDAHLSACSAHNCILYVAASSGPGNSILSQESVLVRVFSLESRDLHFRFVSKK